MLTRWLLIVTGGQANGGAFSSFVFLDPVISNEFDNKFHLPLLRFTSLPTGNVNDSQHGLINANVLNLGSNNGGSECHHTGKAFLAHKENAWG